MFDHERVPGGAAEGPLGLLHALARAASAFADEARTCAAWSASTVADAQAALDRVAGTLATAKAHLLVAQRDSGTGMRAGDRSFEAARARTTRQGLGEAWREVRQADTLVAMPDVAQAVAAGGMSLGHVDVLARQSASAPPRVGDLLRSPAGQAQVLTLARRHAAPEFGRTLAAWVAAQDPAALERDFQAQRRERSLVLTHRPEGTYLRGRLDPVAGHELRLALESAAQVPGPDRSREQAAADALMMLARHGLSCGRARPGPRSGVATVGDGTTTADEAAAAAGAAAAPAGVGAVGPPETADERLTGVANRPHVSLIVPIEALAELRARRQRPRGSRGDPGARPEAHPPDDASADALGAEPPTTGATPPASEDRRPSGEGAGPIDEGAGPIGVVAPATLEDGTPVPWSELARILCDCEVTRVTLDARGEPTDLGRTRRLYTGPQRRAVIARDRACAWNGCGAEARWCEVHHMRWWERDGGATSVENGCLLCEFHHHEVHRLDLSIERLSAPSRVTGLASGPSRPVGATREPARYVFRAPGGAVVNAPDDDPAGGVPPGPGPSVGDAGDRPPAARRDPSAPPSATEPRGPAAAAAREPAPSREPGTPREPATLRGSASSRESATPRGPVALSGSATTRPQGRAARSPSRAAERRLSGRVDDGTLFDVPG